MTTLTYKIIKNKVQYKEYCDELEELVFSESKTSSDKEKIELLTLLIEKYDEEHNSFNELDPIQLLIVLMENHNLKAKNLADMLGVSKGLVSDILNYKKGLSKDLIRILATHFKVSQEALNKPYRLNAENRDKKSKNHEILMNKPTARFGLVEAGYNENTLYLSGKSKIGSAWSYEFFNISEVGKIGDNSLVSEDVVDEEIDICEGKVVKFDAYFQEKKSHFKNIHYKKS